MWLYKVEEKVFWRFSTILTWWRFEVFKHKNFTVKITEDGFKCKLLYWLLRYTFINISLNDISPIIYTNIYPTNYL